MFKYIVTYYIFFLIARAPAVDEFGRELYHSSYFVITDSVQKEKVFDNRDSAMAFIKRGIGHEDLKHFKIDSVLAVQYNCTHPGGSVTALACGDSPCNTFTCGKCGKQWKTY